MLSSDQLKLKSELEKYIGSRYKPGGTGSGGYDCSGFSRSMYQKLFGIDLPHNAQSQFHLPGMSKLNQSSLKTGDLVFFASTAKKKRINHVGIYLDDGQFIHAQTKRGVVVSSMGDDHWRDRLVSMKRIDSKKLQVAQSLTSLQDAEADTEYEEVDGEERGGFEASVSPVRSSAYSPGARGSAKALASQQPKKPRFVELNYVRPVFGRYCNLQMGTFRHDFEIGASDFYTPEPAFDLYSEGGVYSYSRAVRIASDIRPFGWMSLVPSFLYYRHGRELENYIMPERSMGFDLNLGSCDADWSITTGLSYSWLRQTDFHTTRTGDPNLLDISLTYSRRLTDTMQLSLMGQRLRSSAPDRLDDAGSEFSTDQRIFFLLNYSY